MRSKHARQHQGTTEEAWHAEHTTAARYDAVRAMTDEPPPQRPRKAPQRPPGYYQRIGKKGGETTRDRYGPQHFQAISKRKKPPADPNYFRELGQRGGNAPHTKRSGGRPKTPPERKPE